MIKRYSYLLETVLLLAGILLISMMQGNTGFIGEELHPFYLVILAIVLRYGYTRGIPAMLLSSGIYGGLYVLAVAEINLADWTTPGMLVEKVQASGLHIRDLWGRCHQPLAFIALGMFVGWLVERDKQKIQSLGNTISRQSSTISEKDTTIETILAINENISDQLVKTDQTFNILFKRSQSLFQNDVMAMYKAAYDLLLTTTKASRGYVLHLEGDRFTLAFPEQERADSVNIVARNSNLIKTIRESQECLRCDMLDEHELSEHAPVFIGPILHQTTKTLYGLLVVQELDFTRYNDNTFLTFKNLCAWLGEVFYARSEQYPMLSPVAKPQKVFPYIVDVGATRADIHTLIKECFQ